MEDIPMGKGRAWTAQEKASSVSQGLKERGVAEICNERQIHRTRFYRWRDQFLANAPKVFATKRQFQREQRRWSANLRWG
jgi:hypothetical protein